MKTLRASLLVAVFPALGLNAQLPSREAQAQFSVAHTPSSNAVLNAAPQQAVTPEVSSYAERLLKDHGIPGITLGFVRVGEDGSVATELAGWGNMTEDGMPVTPETMFSIGSCSKAFMSAAMGLLIDDFAHGRNVTQLPVGVKSLTWQTKVQDLLPAEDWELADEWATEKLSLIDAMSHVSGLPRHDMAYSRQDTPKSVIKRMKHMRPYYELRERYSYNNQMFMLVQHVHEIYAGKPLPEFVEERIFSPLNMTTATYSGREAEDSGHLSQGFAAGRRIPYWFGDDLPSRMIAGAGGVIATPLDMTKWLATLLNEGVNPTTGETVIPEDIFRQLTTMYTIASGKPNKPRNSISGYGTAWARMSIQGHDVVWHSGGLPGFYSEAWFFPEDHIGVFTSENSDGPASYALALRVAEAYLNLELTPAPDVPSPNQESSDSSPTPPTDFEVDVLHSYTGTYTNPGYGKFTLCTTTASDIQGCATILDTYASTADGPLDAAVLYGEFMPARIWATQFRMRPTAAAEFVLEAEQIFPRGYGRNETPFSLAMSPSGTPVRCVRKGSAVVGCGLMDIGLAGEGDMTWKRREGGVEDIADAWFVKL
ncbi:beta-lactamase/transpeptidase-like protein [Epithele typhae]|uniref:beta-lactamase/transpeptidase-like protein n=1 Tax=Epithele typhae TaxID=378194 RepID=UPI00200895F3|nr:beta-lactamase/transpeptidase-like protein [Epithele typhae]KAH9925641.1 beta-lactamase/transpeptidase-like protein [Epithele typhae]